MKKSTFVSQIAVFAALNVVCDALVIPQFSSGVWYGLVFLTVPITGIVLGPYVGFLSTLIGVLIGHTLIPRGAEELFFTLGAPIGAAISGLVVRRSWKLPFLYYITLIAAYLVTPVAWQLPILGMWDVYCAYLVLFITVLLIIQRGNRIDLADTPWFHAFSAFIGLEADILFRIFIFIPCQTYHSIYNLPIEALQSIWITGALITPLKVATSCFITALLGNKLPKFSANP